ncbi:MAG: RsmD family RNA methyltransferase [bacterium]|nr:RsmD family RNA methyltransferase [bacterium]
MKPAALKLISGRLKGRRLAAPKGLDTRPSLEKTRGVVFDVLGYRAELSEFAAVDLFAGSGALGLEAYSRGCEPLVFCESLGPSFTQLKANVEALLPTESFRLFKGDGLSWLRQATPGERPWLFLLDPPYGKSLGAQALDLLSQRAQDFKGSVVVLEADKKDEPAARAGLENFSAKILGRSRLDFFWIEP